MNEHVESLNHIKTTAIDLAIKFGPKVLVAIIIIAVGVAYDTDLNKALATIDEVLRNNPRVLKEPAAGTGISVLADSSIQLAVKPWTTVVDYGPAGSEINQAIVEAFRSRNIVIPFPQHEVRMLANAA